MSGHSKWANIKHRKAGQDAKRGKIFTKMLREITVAVKTSGSDAGSNPTLRTAIDKALGANMRRDTIDTAIKGAETGHLVIASMPTADTVSAIERVIATLPRDEREVTRMRFAESLCAIVAQQLLPEKNEKGRVAAVEVLLATPAVRECIREHARIGELRKLMADGRKQSGSQTYEQHLTELVESGLIAQETARAAGALSAPASAGGKRGKQR